MLLTLTSFDSSRKTPPSPLDSFRTLAVLRMGAGLVLFFKYALEGSVKAWQFIWQHKPWDLVATLEQAGVIWPQVSACTAAFVALAVALAWILGGFTRLLSALFLPVLLVTLSMQSSLHVEAHATAAWLFLFIAITLLLYGSGRLSLDGLLQTYGRPKKRRSMF